MGSSWSMTTIPNLCITNSKPNTPVSSNGNTKNKAHRCGGCGSVNPPPREAHSHREWGRSLPDLHPLAGLQPQSITGFGVEHLVKLIDVFHYLVASELRRGVRIDGQQADGFFIPGFHAPNAGIVFQQKA